jgi:FkbM family methyltransferase
MTPHGAGRPDRSGVQVGVQSALNSILVAFMRLPGRRFPIKGWAQVTEFIHRRIRRPEVEAIYRNQYGVILRLDLTDLIQRSIYYDTWECDELNLLIDVMRPEDVMLDIGANIGLFSMVGARAAGVAGEVHAFEPVPENCDRFAENLQLNGFANVRLNQMAVADHRGQVRLAIDAGMASSSGSNTSGCFTMSKLTNPVREIVAPVDTIDSYAEQHLRERQIRFVKIDVEGAEAAVLKGMRSTLAAHRADIVLLEVNLYTLSLGGYGIRNVVEPFLHSDYALYRLGAAGILWRWSYRGEPTLPHRTTWARGSLCGVYQGVQDLPRLFSLVAIRGDLPSLRQRPRAARARSITIG